MAGRWRWRRKHARTCSGGDRPDARAILERIQAQEPTVDDVVARIEHRYQDNTFREWWDDAMKPRPHHT